MNTQELTAAADEARSKLGASGPRRLESFFDDLPRTALPKTVPAAPPEPEFTTTRDLIIERLLSLPALIHGDQQGFDEADRAYQTRLANLTVSAFSAPLFPGKELGTVRAASNDKEREAAIDKLISGDATLITLAQQREAALRTLQFNRNQFEATKIAAQLLTASNL